jgi:hypothetical protein
MDENLHDIDKLFRDPIEEHEEMPSAKIWDAIDSNLDKSNIVSIKKKYNNLKKMAVALLLLLLGTIAYEIQTKKAGDKDIAVKEAGKGNSSSAEKSNTTSNKETNTTVKKENTKTADSENDSSANNYTTNNALKTTDEKKSTLNTNTTNTPEKSPAVKKEREVTIADQNKILIKKNSINKKNEGAADATVNNYPTEDKYVSEKKKSSSGTKTKIKIRNVAAEEEVDEASAVTKNSNSNSATGLVALINTPAEPMLFNDGRKQLPLLQIKPAAVLPESNTKNSLVKNKSSKTAKAFHFSLTPFVSPQFSFNRLEDDHHDTGPQPRNDRDHIKKEEQHQSSTAMGIFVDIPVGKKWSLQSGIAYTNTKTAIEPKKIFAKLDADGQVKYRFDCSSGYTYIAPKTGATPVVGDSINAAASTNTLKYIGVPLSVNYHFTLGKFSIVPNVGMMANFLVKQQIQTEIIQGSNKQPETINTIQGMKPTYFNAFTAVAFEYNFSKRIALSIMPSGNFALSSINKDAAVKSYPNSFGVSGGIKIKF